ncbi:MAG: transporter substrate-binding domain-containing protein [Pseudomonadota bacterium]
MKKSVIAVTIACAVAFQGRAHSEVVNVYTSAISAPLVISDTQGVYPDMIAYLNRQNLDRLTFKLSYLPRKRLQLKIEKGEIDGIVIGMMPHWFDDGAQQKYLWTMPFAIDRYVVVMRPDLPYNARQPGSLSGRSAGMVLGYNYPDLEPWMREQNLVRNDAASEDINLEKLRLGRVDCVITIESVVRYYLKTHAVTDQFKLYELPARPTERRFLVPHSKAAVFDKIAPLMRKLKDDPDWQRDAARYR